MRWYADDFATAQACAKQRKLPLVIDLWAPWCHTCISVQQTILNDPSLAPFAEQFVWVSLDTDKPINAEATRIYPPLAWPTFYIVAPEQASVLARFVGAPSLQQFTAMLTTAVASSTTSSTPEQLVRSALSAEQSGAWTDAERLYRKALASAAPDWTRRPDILTSLLRGHVRAGTCSEAIDIIRNESTHLGTSASTADFTYYAHRCLQPVATSTEAIDLLQPLQAKVLAAVDEGKDMSTDDRSDALRILRQIAVTQDKKELAHQLAQRQRALLDEAIRTADNPTVAMGYNWPAAEVYNFLKIPEKLIPTLQKSIKALPTEYDPPYRLAWILLQAQQPDRAMSPAKRALALVYGPRKARVYDLIAEIQRARNDLEGERSARKGTVEVLQNLPEGQRNPAYLKAAQQALSELPAPKAKTH